jgi:hypothetical protein
MIEIGEVVSYLAEGAEDIGLPQTVRDVLAAHLLGSLPSVLHDDDEGLAEALRRDSEFVANLRLGMTLEELDCGSKPSELLRLVLHLKVLDPGVDRRMAEYEQCRLECSWI